MNLKGVVFDMDGVLIDARDWHRDALNIALDYFGAAISNEEHLEKFDGLPTKKKLAMLSEEGRLPRAVHQIVEAIKQDRTMRIANQHCFPRPNLLIAVKFLKRKGLKVAVATNSVRQTAELMLEKSGLLCELDLLLTNQDVERPKPDPEIYLRAMGQLGLSAQETVIVEDNPNGIRAAQAAGCRVIQVASPSEVNVELLQSFLSESET